MNTEYQRKLAKVNEQNRQLRKQLAQMNHIKTQNSTLKLQINFSNDMLGKQYKKLQQTQQLLRSAENALIEKDQLIEDMNKYMQTEWCDDDEDSDYQIEDDFEQIDYQAETADNQKLLFLLKDMHKILLQINSKMEYPTNTINWTK